MLRDKLANRLSLFGFRPVRGVCIRTLEPPGTPMIEHVATALLPYASVPQFRYKNQPHPRASIYVLKSQGIGELSVTDVGRIELDYVPLRHLDWWPHKLGVTVFSGGLMFVLSGMLLAISMHPLALVGMIAGLAIFAAALFFIYYVPTRERQIREAIGDLTGMAIDPAIIREDMARRLWQMYADDQNAYANINLEQAVRDAAAMGIPPTSPNSPVRRQVLLHLLFARLWLALGGDKAQYERVTDEALGRIKAV